MSKISRGAALAACALVGAIAPISYAGEVWVLAERSAKVHIIETVSLATTSFALPNPSTAPLPSSLAFSTVDGTAGRFAFVGRGRERGVAIVVTPSAAKGYLIEGLDGVRESIADWRAALDRPLRGGAAARLDPMRDGD